MSEKGTTIHVSRETKKELDKLKVHPREPYEDVVKRLIKECQKSK
jgi:predicted CopG family antitoxin